MVILRRLIAIALLLEILATGKLMWSLMTLSSAIGEEGLGAVGMLIALPVMVLLAASARGLWTSHAPPFVRFSLVSTAFLHTVVGTYMLVTVSSDSGLRDFLRPCVLLINAAILGHTYIQSYYEDSDTAGEEWG